VTPRAKALLRILVGSHVVRVRKGEREIRLSPIAVINEHGLGIPPSDIDALVDELVREGLGKRTDGGHFELTRKALEKTL
jgi:DNA-binding IclR family transcriptional regulator